MAGKAEKTSRGGNSREDRLRRWFLALPPGADMVRLEVLRAGAFEALSWATAADLEERAADVAEAFSVALQDEADTTGGRVRARVAAFEAGADAPLASTKCQADPGDDADPLPEVRADGTPESMLAQQQIHNQALVKLVIEQSMSSIKANKAAMDAVVAVLERLDARLEREASAVDAFREAAQGDEGGTVAAEVVDTLAQRLLPTVNAAIQVWAQRKAAGPAPSASPGPVVDGEVEP